MSGTSVTITDGDLQFGPDLTAAVTFTATYDSAGDLTGVSDPTLVLTEAGGTTETFTAAYVPGGNSGSPYQILFGGFPTDSNGNPGEYGYVYLDYTGEAPTTIDTTEPNGQYSSIAQQVGSPIALTSGGTAEATCFVGGTQIAVPGGTADIATLRMGDLVVLSDGRAAPIRWIGRLAIATRFADWLKTAPIRVSAGALDDNLPVRDLLVSSCHALLVDGVLVQAGALVNGSTIVRQRAVPETFTYYHLELEGHELIVAEGVAAETFVDNADRMYFDNWAEHQALFGTDVQITEMSSPRAKSARQVPAATLRRLSERAAVLVPAAA